MSKLTSLDKIFLEDPRRMEMGKGNFIDLLGYENEYKINIHGEILSLPKKLGIKYANYFTPLKILKPILNKKDNYYRIALTKNKVTKTMLLHRLIAIHFVPNPENLKYVNHKNGIKTDNRIENLEWCNRFPSPSAGIPMNRMRAALAFQRTAMSFQVAHQLGRFTPIPTTHFRCAGGPPRGGPP